MDHLNDSQASQERTGLIPHVKTWHGSTEGHTELQPFEKNGIEVCLQHMMDSILGQDYFVFKCKVIKILLLNVTMI